MNLAHRLEIIAERLCNVSPRTMYAMDRGYKGLACCKLNGPPPPLACNAYTRRVQCISREMRYVYGLPPKAFRDNVCLFSVLQKRTQRVLKPHFFSGRVLKNAR